MEAFKIVHKHGVLNLTPTVIVFSFPFASPPKHRNGKQHPMTKIKSGTFSSPTARPLSKLLVNLCSSRYYLHLLSFFVSLRT